MRECSTLETLQRGAAQLGVELPGGAAMRMLAHLELLAQWNRRVNLTAIRDIDDMVVRHLLDSLAIAKFVRGESLIDIGSGAGFPGVPLAVAMPGLRVTLLDSRLRRVEFLRAAVAELQLANAEVMRARVETVRPRGKFDNLALRAFAPLHRALQLTAHLHRPGARLLAMKGRAPTAEIAEVEAAARAKSAAKFAAATITVRRLSVPFLRAERHLVVAEF